MDIASTLLTLFSASFGAFLTYRMQSKLLDKKISFELAVREVELEFEKEKHATEKLGQIIAEAHILASELEREFSLTFLNIDWQARISVGEYDSKYRMLREKCSRLQMLVDLHAPDLSTSVTKLEGEMNMYWGYFRTVLYQTHDGKSPSELGEVFDNAVAYSLKVPKLAIRLKERLSRYFQEATN